MNSSAPWLPMTLSGLLAQSPLIVAALIGLILCAVRWRDAPTASRWTLAASLLSLFVCVAAPLSQGLMMSYLRDLAYPAARMGVLFSGLGFVWSTLRAVSVGFLLIGVYSGRAVSSGVRTFPTPVDYPPATNL